ncbi:hypothetical protein DPEC_G00067580 [Dallia pectoralis]|uniref:Uncharacterized protein n=1 Tax=Dallia pectoralis TaxID=75939 RepID=A0ACC2H8R7_DALPE|nr:hypothetical protein DPEC_G00067580 [Dallia pectoralis]
MRTITDRPLPSCTHEVNVNTYRAYLALGSGGPGTDASQRGGGPIDLSVWRQTEPGGAHQIAVTSCCRWESAGSKGGSGRDLEEVEIWVEHRGGQPAVEVMRGDSQLENLLDPTFFGFEPPPLVHTAGQAGHCSCASPRQPQTMTWLRSQPSLHASPSLEQQTLVTP